MATRLTFTPGQRFPLDEYAEKFNERKAKRAIVEATSADVASIAGRGLNRPWSLSNDEIRIVCASALRQTIRDAVRQN